MNIAIIPARGGSKRIKNKNVKFFFNKPVIYWSIKAAKQSKLFDKIIVSTDSKKIANICKKYNVEVPFLRPKILSNDKASTAKVVKHALLWFKNKGIFFDRVCCIYAAAPFISKKTIRDSISDILTEIQKGGLDPKASEFSNMSKLTEQVRVF